jgi:hypothetical protein
MKKIAIFAVPNFDMTAKLRRSAAPEATAYGSKL